MFGFGGGLGGGDRGSTKGSVAARTVLCASEALGNRGISGVGGGLAGKAGPVPWSAVRRLPI